MFYSYEVLLPPEAKLNVVWLLGGGFSLHHPGASSSGGGGGMMARRRHLKTAALRLDLKAVCEEIANRLPVQSRNGFSLRLVSYLYFGAASAHEIKAGALLKEIRLFRTACVVGPPSNKSGDETAIRAAITEETAVTMGDPLDVAQPEDAAGYGELAFPDGNNNQGRLEQITLREEDADTTGLPRLVDDASNDFGFGTEPAPPGCELGAGGGIFDPEPAPAGPEVTVNNGRRSCDAMQPPGAPERTNGVRNVKDQMETPAVGDGDEQPPRKRPRRPLMPPDFVDSDLDPEDDRAPPVVVAEGGDLLEDIPPAAPIEVDPPLDLPAAAPVEKDPPLDTLPTAPVVEPAKKKRKIIKLFADPEKRMQVDLKSNFKSADSHLRTDFARPDVHFVSADRLLAAAGRACHRDDIKENFEERALAAFTYDDDDDGVGQQPEEHDPDLLRSGMGSNINLTKSSAGNQTPQDTSTRGGSILPPAVLPDEPLLNTINEENEQDVSANPPQPDLSAHAAPELPPPILDSPPPVAVNGNRASSVAPSETDSIASSNWCERGVIEQEVLSATDRRPVYFDDLVAGFKGKRAVAKMFALLLNMEKAGRVENEQRPGTFGGPIKITKMK